MFTISVSVKGMPQALDHIRRVRKAIEDSKDDLAFAALNRAAELFEQNFMSEGGAVGGWADLADSTVREREALGFGGEHPILVRYGDLRNITTTSLKAAGRSGTFSATDNGGKTITVTLKANRGVLNVSALGEKAINQEAGDDRPARPYWFVDGNVQQAAREGVVRKLAADIGRL